MISTHLHCDHSHTPFTSPIQPIDLPPPPPAPPSPAPSSPRSPSYLIRTDTYITSPSNSSPLLHILMELPGFKPADVSISLHTHPIARLKSLKVQGRSRPPPGRGSESGDVGDTGDTMQRERKYGNASRSVRVPEVVKVRFSFTSSSSTMVI